MVPFVIQILISESVLGSSLFLMFAHLKLSRYIQDIQVAELSLLSAKEKVPVLNFLVSPKGNYQLCIISTKDQRMGKEDQTSGF